MHITFKKKIFRELKRTISLILIYTLKRHSVR